MICLTNKNIDIKILRQDFYRQFGPRCAGCQLVFSETEKVRKIDQSLFHGHCFKCSVCSKDLTEAEKVGCDQNGNLLCETDFLKNHCDDLDNGGHSERLLDECESDKKDESHLPNRDLTEGLSEEEQEINKEVIDDPMNYTVVLQEWYESPTLQLPLSILVNGKGKVAEKRDRITIEVFEDFCCKVSEATVIVFYKNYDQGLETPRFSNLFQETN